MSPGQRALNRLAKWRTVLAGWQLGTRAKGDPECDAVRDQRQALLVLRAEVTALTGLLMRHANLTAEQVDEAFRVEAEHLCTALEQRFPGFKATDVGLEMDSRIAAETTKGWRP